MPKPLIGITMRNEKDLDESPFVAVGQNYIRAIVQAGGLPFLIPSMLNEEDFNDIYSRLDGILFSGGGDVSLEYFSGADHPRIGTADDERDFTEISLLGAAANDGKPLLGICRGAQVMNIALGGTLYTHIPDQLPNAIDHHYPGHLRKTLVHPVHVDEASKAAEIFGETLLQVNSLHHQGVKDLAPRIKAVGYAPDNLPEVVEIADHPFAIGVQWHPEWLTDQPAMQRLFKAFVSAASKNK